MSGHATAEDALHAAFGLGRTVLNDLDEKNRKKADAFLNTVPAWYDVEISNYERDNPFNFQGNPDDPKELEDYTKKYHKAQENFIYGKFAQKFGSNVNQGYYRRAMEQMQTKALEIARGSVLRKQDDTRQGIARNRFASSAENYAEKLPPDEAWKAFNYSIGLLEQDVEVSPEDKYKFRTNFGKQIYGKAAESLLGSVNDVNQLGAAMEALKERFSFMPKDVFNTFDEEGNVTGTEEKDWSFAGKEEYEKKLLEAHEKRIQEARFGVFQERQSYVDRLVMSGDIRGAIDECRKWGPEWNKYYDPNRPEFANSNEDLRDAGSNFFDVGRYEAALKQTEKERIIEFDPGRVIRAALGGGFVVTDEKTGDGFEVSSLRDGWDKYISLREKAFRQVRGYGALADNDWLNARERYFREFNDMFKNITRDEKEYVSLWAEYSKLLNTETYDKKDTPFFVKNEFEGELRDRFIQDCMSLAYDLAWNGADLPTLKNKVMNYIIGTVDNKMTWGTTPAQEGDVLKKLAAWSGEVMSGKANEMVFSKTRMETASAFSSEPQEDDLVWRMGKESFKKDAHNVREAERSYTANILGLPVEALTPGWMLSNDNEKDPIPKGIFVIEQGEHAGTYYLDYNGARPVVKKQNEKGEWKPYKEMEGAITRDEYIQAIRNGKDPITGKDFDYSRPPPGSGLGQTQWDRGYRNVPRDYMDKAGLWANYFMKQNRWGL